MSELVRDGVRLWYEEAGTGEPPLLFVHGWCCDHTYFERQFDHFRRRHLVVSIDLRGHGQSDKPEQDYTISGFADDVVWIARQLELANVVVIGHSLGGITGLEAAARHPDVVAAAVLIEPAPVVWPPGVKDIARALVEQLRGPAYEDAVRQYVSQAMFLPTDDPELRARVVDAMSSVPQHVMASVLDQIVSWDGPAVASACTVPVLAIVAAMPVGDMAAFRELCPSLVTGQTVGAGHFNQLLVPDQVNSMIERFLENEGLASETQGAALRAAP